MKNPTYQSRYQPEILELEIGLYHDANYVSFFTRSPAGPRFVYLDKDQIKDVVAQLQSFIDNECWIKPKKRYVVVEDKPDSLYTWLIKTDGDDWRSAIQDSSDSIEVYELTEENKVK